MYGIHLITEDIESIDKIKEDITNKIKDKCNIFQLFVDIKPTSVFKYKDLKKFGEQNKIKFTVHASYYINLAQNWNFHSWWIKQFIEEIKMAELLGAIAIVVHIGKKLDLEQFNAINNMYTSLLHIHNETSKLKIKILLETSTGQGSEMLYNLDELSVFFKKFLLHKNKPLKNITY